MLSLMLSSFILVPQLTQMLSSARFKNGNEKEGAIATYLEILSHVEGDYTTRWWSLLGISFACAIITVGIIKNRKDKKQVFMSVSLILMVVLELFFESINLIWHFGSYVQYPIRNGFIIYFVFAVVDETVDVVVGDYVPAARVEHVCQQGGYGEPVFQERLLDADVHIVDGACGELREVLRCDAEVLQLDVHPFDGFEVEREVAVVDPTLVAQVRTFKKTSGNAVVRVGVQHDTEPLQRIDVKNVV